MSALTLEFPTARFSIEAPPDALERLRVFYPRSLSRLHDVSLDAEYSLEKDDDEWRLTDRNSSLGAFPTLLAALLALEFEIESVLAVSTSDILALHAGGVVTEAGAWLIAGLPNAGKTSLTFQLVELGQSFMCEEIALVDPATREVVPHLQTLSLDETFLADYRRHFTVTTGEIHELERHLFRFVPHRMTRTPARLDAILLPRFQTGVSPSVERLPPEGVLIEFLGCCFPPRCGEESLFDAVIQLLERTLVLRITYGSAKEARALLTELLDETAGDS